MFSRYQLLSHQAVDVRVGLVDLTEREKQGNSAKIVDVKVILNHNHSSSFRVERMF